MNYNTCPMQFGYEDFEINIYEDHAIITFTVPPVLREEQIDLGDGGEIDNYVYFSFQSREERVLQKIDIGKSVKDIKFISYNNGIISYKLKLL